MRKNGINRELIPIDGGICAPSGFKTNGVACGIKSEERDFGILVSERKCPTACVYSQCVEVGAPVLISKKHLKNGYAQAVVFNGGRANVFHDNGEDLAERICRLVEAHAKVDAVDTLIASTGEIKKALILKPFEDSIADLVKGLGDDQIHSTMAAEVLMTNDCQLKQFSYSFELGAFSCKIGGIFKGNRYVCPNMATVLGIITTDVNITPEMLQRALSAEAKESFNLLNLDGISSPNDMICIMANGRAGNAKIDCVDSEYEKFCLILHEVATRMCRAIAEDDGSKRFVCKVSGVKSKQVSRTIAKAVVGANSVKQSLQSGDLDIESLLFCIVGAGVEVDTEKLVVELRSENGKAVLWEEGDFVSLCDKEFEKILSAREVELLLNFRKGNYSSSAFGRL